MSEIVIGGHYQLNDELGAGGMGTVYRGTDTRTNVTVAIKQLKSDVAQPENIERFRREGEALRDLNHPNIVKMLDTFEHENQHYLVMEYVSGGDLKGLIENRGKIPYQDCVNMAIDLADALTRAHRLDIIHRDLKPENVLIGDDGVLRLTDFGVAHMGSKGRVTETGMAMGTIPYMPPEAFTEDVIDSRYDIWAFGVMLFEMLAGQRPFDNAGLINNILTAPIPDLEALCPDAPIALVDLVYRMLERELSARIPSVRYVGAELEDILTGRDQKPTPTQAFDTDSSDFALPPKHNLPADTTPFVGRETELNELENLIKSPDNRLTTIVAQGGMGKTRLALELGRQTVDTGLFTNGVYFVELAPLSDADNIPNAIGDACGFQFLGEGTPKQQLLSILRDRNMLLILDNYEHLPEGFNLVGDILKSAPHLQIVVTSRQPVAQAGETLFYLSGMDFPEFESPEDALEYAAVNLFMNSARRANPTFELTIDNLDTIIRICKLVQGMPLGIVLAASWLTLLDITEIATEIQGGLDFLESDEASDLPERQRSIRAVMDYSWEQMSEAEQQVFMRLSVFRGGFTREAAQAVTEANLRVLMSLVKKSLIRRNAQTGRYEIHELLRQYAEEQLKVIGEFDRIQTAHRTYFAEFMAERAIDIKGRRQIDGLNEVESDWDNILQAWELAVKQVNYHALDQMMEALALFVDMRARFNEGEKLFREAVHNMSSLLGSQSHPVQDMLWLRWVQVQTLQEHLMAPEHGRSQSIKSQLQQHLDEAKRRNNHATTAFCLWLLGELHRLTGDAESGLMYYDQSLTIFQQLNESFYSLRILRGTVFCKLFLLNITEGMSPFLKEYLDLAQTSGNINEVAQALFYEAEWVDRMNNYIRSEPYFESVGRAFQRTGDQKSMSINLATRAGILLFKGDFDQAIAFSQQAVDIADDVGFPWSKGFGLLVLGAIAMLRGDYTTGIPLCREGQALTLVAGGRTIRILKSLCHTLLALADETKRKQHLQWVFKIMIDNKSIPELTVVSLPVIAIIVAHELKKDRAVHLLGLAFSQPEMKLMKCINEWTELIQLRQDLKAQLGEDAYNQTWEQGKSLDLEITVNQLVEEFSETDD